MKTEYYGYCPGCGLLVLTPDGDDCKVCVCGSEMEWGVIDRVCDMRHRPSEWLDMAREICGPIVNNQDVD
jgi:hypothetical protein